jgi:hypothetical protein
VAFLFVAAEAYHSLPQILNLVVDESGYLMDSKVCSRCLFNICAKKTMVSFDVHLSVAAAG